MEAQQHISSLHHDIESWKVDVDFVRKDVRILKERLVEISGKNTSKEVMVQVEHFQNLFLRQHEVADELFHDLKQANRNLRTAVLQVPVFYGPELEDEHAVLRDRVEIFNKLFHELKNEFNHFLGKWL
ncbi:MAG TPA: hypothetical protein VNE41_03190 [Chitinophagaceae bacterium]|nr:hypothetical protein [Chitinophagaceae bacterium]